MDRRHTWAAFDIVESEVRHSRVELHQEGKGLADTAGTAKDSNFGCLRSKKSAYISVRELLRYLCSCSGYRRAGKGCVLGEQWLRNFFVGKL